MDPLDDLFALAQAYTHATGLAESTVSERVLKGGNRLRRLRAGQSDIGVRRLKRAILWFSSNWPVDVPWPSEIRRHELCPSIFAPPPPLARNAEENVS